MSFIRNLTIACSLLFAGSVVRADDAAPSKEDIAKFLKFFDQVVDVMVADKDVCPKMATDLNTLIDANKDMIEGAKKAQASGQKLPPDAVKHLMDATKRMGPAMQKCIKDKDVMAALDRFPHGPPPQHK